MQNWFRGDNRIPFGMLRAITVRCSGTMVADLVVCCSNRNLPVGAKNENEVRTFGDASKAFVSFGRRELTSLVVDVFYAVFTMRITK